MEITTNLRRDRRVFLKSNAAFAALAAIGQDQPRRADTAEGTSNTSASSTIALGVMGVNNRGAALAAGFASLPNVKVATICDVDESIAGRVAKKLADAYGRQPKICEDFRRMLDDKSIDAIVIAAPNHWHAPATILACAAGKHVYVEKPCSHTPEEGELTIAAARKHNRVVEMGVQRRSWPAIREAIQKIRDGAIGEVHYSRTWYNNRRESIGTLSHSKPPIRLNWDLWQGPSARREYQENILPYHWHWWWNWGNGELGNNGIHAIDIARWGLGVDFPTRVAAGGGKYRHQDDQETPDTLMVTYDFPDNKTITWEGLSWSPLGPDHSRFGLSFHGTEGSIVMRDPGYTVFDMQDKEISTHQDRAGDLDHLANFVSAMRDSTALNASIEEGHRSTLMCHLGNIAFRTQTHLQIDPTSGRIQNLNDADQWWSKEYAKGWKPSV